jgi:hypothetical protein
MRKARYTLVGLVGLTSVAFAATARAQDPMPVTETAAPRAAKMKFEIGLAFLPMAKGTFTAAYGPDVIDADAKFAPGYLLTIGYEVIPGLSVGVAPQWLTQVQPKTDPTESGTPITAWNEYDLLARVAYGYRFVEATKVYAEVLPGYSIMKPAEGHASKGFVIAFGAGLALDMGDHAFANLGVGYQQGFQNLPATDLGAQTRTSYWRFAIGGGARF